MKLCFGTWGNVLKLCKKGKTSQVELFKTILKIADPECNTLSDTKVSRLLSCKEGFVDKPKREDDEKQSNRLGNFISGARKANKEDVIGKFEADIVDLIIADKRAQVVLALLDIIKQDKTIDNDNKLSFEEYIGTTKEKLLSQDEYVFSEFLAKIFLYTVAEVDNNDGKEYAGKIDKEYIDSFDSEKDTIKIWKSYSHKNEEGKEKASPEEDKANYDMNDTSVFYDPSNLPPLTDERIAAIENAGKDTSGFGLPTEIENESSYFDIDDSAFNPNLAEELNKIGEIFTKYRVAEFLDSDPMESTDYYQWARYIGRFLKEICAHGLEDFMNLRTVPKNTYLYQGN